jgi:hypothetical protein
MIQAEYRMPRATKKPNRRPFEPVPGFENPERPAPYRASYLVSASGEVLSMRTPNAKFLKATITTLGYKRVRLHSDDGPVEFLIHELVARCYLGPKPPGARIRHLDGCKLNNDVSNLRYVVSTTDKFARKPKEADVCQTS